MSPDCCGYVISVKMQTAHKQFFEGKEAGVGADGQDEVAGECVSLRICYAIYLPFSRLELSTAINDFRERGKKRNAFTLPLNGWLLLCARESSTGRTFKERYSFSEICEYDSKDDVYV